jgi:hypothetical protein
MIARCFTVDGFLDFLREITPFASSLQTFDVCPATENIKSVFPLPASRRLSDVDKHTRNMTGIVMQMCQYYGSILVYMGASLTLTLLPPAVETLCPS